MSPPQAISLQEVSTDQLSSTKPATQMPALSQGEAAVNSQSVQNVGHRSQEVESGLTTANLMDASLQQQALPRGLDIDGNGSLGQVAVETGSETSNL